MVSAEARTASISSGCSGPDPAGLRRAVVEFAAHRRVADERQSPHGGRDGVRGHGNLAVTGPGAGDVAAAALGERAGEGDGVERVQRPVPTGRRFAPLVAAEVGQVLVVVFEGPQSGDLHPEELR